NDRPLTFVSAQFRRCNPLGSDRHFFAARQAEYSWHVCQRMTRAFCIAATAASLVALAQGRVSTEQADATPIATRTTAALTRMIDEPWHPIPTDPIWTDIRPVIDAALAADPTSSLAMLARRAAARVDIRID